MGRPRKYTKKALDEAVEEYFAMITRIKTVTEKKPTKERDERGHIIFEEVPVLNRLGQEMTCLEYLVPPTVGGLCEHLGIHRSTWAEYCDKNLHPEFIDTTTRTRGRLRAYLEQELLTRKDVKGIIFDLQNNYGYADRKQLDLSDNAARAMSAAAMPMEEKQQLLRQIAMDFGGGDDDDPPDQQTR